jgi:hypothetical protein
VKPKSANIAGLQLADVLAHPVRQEMLREADRITAPMSPFGERLAAVIWPKFNRHFYRGRVWGYGKVLFPNFLKPG